MQEIISPTPEASQPDYAAVLIFTPKNAPPFALEAISALGGPERLAKHFDIPIPEVVAWTRDAVPWEYRARLIELIKATHPDCRRVCFTLPQFCDPSTMEAPNA
jgi:hypothetical protein